MTKRFQRLNALKKQQADLEAQLERTQAKIEQEIANLNKFTTKWQRKLNRDEKLLRQWNEAVGGEC
jgi:multidrug resistance efflux pump